MPPYIKRLSINDKKLFWKKVRGADESQGVAHDRGWGDSPVQAENIIEEKKKNHAILKIEDDERREAKKKRSRSGEQRSCERETEEERGRERD